MGREIRKVPSNWEHPKDEHGHYIPLNDQYYCDAVDEWFNNHKLWLEGKHPDQLGNKEIDYKFFCEWGGDAPNLEVYRQVKWAEEEATHFQMYETVSEGTPVSPVFASLQLLEDWLVKSGGYSRHAAHQFVESGSAPSFVMSMGKIKDGIQAADGFDE